MAHLPIARFARDLFDFNHFFGPSLELFDPFDEHDLSLYSSIFPSLHWLHKPHILDARGRQRPKPEKYRITLNVAGIDKDNVKTFMDGKKLVVSARQENKSKSGDFDTREFRKSFDVPENAITEHLTSFITPNGTLVVEIPLKVENKVERAVDKLGTSLFDFDEFFNSSFYPKIVDGPDGQKKIEMTVDVRNFKPNDVHVNLKDNELIVKAESNVVDNGSVSKSTYYKQVTLPPGTNVEKLNTVFKDGVLAIDAPYEKPPCEHKEGEPCVHKAALKPCEHKEGEPCEHKEGEPCEHKAAGKPCEHKAAGKPCENKEGEPCEHKAAGKPCEHKEGEPCEHKAAEKPCEHKEGEPCEHKKEKPEEAHHKEGEHGKKESEGK